MSDHNVDSGGARALHSLVLLGTLTFTGSLVAADQRLVDIVRHRDRLALNLVVEVVHQLNRVRVREEFVT